MIDYFLKVLLFQTLFLVVYDTMLKRETFFQWNRVYLILTSILAYSIPVLKFEKAQEIIPQEYIMLPEVMLSPTSVIEQKVEQSSMLFSSLTLIFWIGFGIAAILFSLKLYKLLRLIFDSEKQNKSTYWLVFVQQNKAFSFFSYIFLNKAISEATKEQVIEHELVHVQQKHSLDLLWFEIQRMVCWFNPYSYIYQHRISELHEFIADAKAIKQKDKTTYFESLLAQTFGVNHISFINPFFKHSLIKKRILMLNKSRSKQLLKLKYVLLIPILASMLIYTSCERTEVEIQKDVSAKELIAELNAKAEEGKLTEEDEKQIAQVLSKITINGVEVSKREQEIKEALYLHLLNKRNNVLSEASKKDYSNAEIVPFSHIEQVPIFPSCEENIDSKKCFQEKIRAHVSQNFDKTIANSLGLDSEYKKVYVQFTIAKNGMITNIRCRGPHKVIEKEAIRVIQSLPQMKAGEYNGKKVAVKYTLPITFKVE